MKRANLISRILIAPAVIFGLVWAVSGTVSAQDDEAMSEATLEIHKAECFHGVGSDIFENCHDNTLEGISFTVNGAEGTTDESGRISFHGPATTVTITEDPDVFAQYLGAYVYCRDLTDDVVLFDGSAVDTGGAVTIDIEDGDQVVCDWYDIVEGADTTGDTGEDVGGTTTLPQTGQGSGAAEPQGNTPLLVGLLGVVATIGAVAFGLRRDRRAAGAGPVGLPSRGQGR
ncbi:MAG TPA: hypothetical protein VH482_27280 [Thermomicrobiales bacterium]|jgi:hypothetical protein